jgi:AAA family ATP:ADP antiporter
MIVSQFWAFANDVYTEDQGKRLFPIVGIGASAGALVGAFLTADVFEKMSNGALMTLSCALLGCFIVLIVWVNKREVSATPAGAEDKAEETLSKEGGFSLVRKNRYLLLIAFFVLLLNMVNSVGEFILGSLFAQEAIAEIGAGEALQAQRGEFIRTLYADFFGWVNLAGLIIQSFLVSRFIKYFGVRGSLFIGPIMSLITYGTTALAPVLNVVRGVKIAENSNDYSTNNTVRQALFLPMSRDVKYKAKAAIDTFFGRSGDALQALVVFIGTHLSLAIPGFAVINVALVGIWLGVTAGIAKEHKKLAEEA